MILKQHYLGCLSHASYFIGDEKSKEAAIVDPQRDVDVYLEEARRHGLRITRVLLNHFHADFVAGHLELRERTGAEIWLGARAEAEYAFRPMRDGGSVSFGDVRLEFLETPGHTPEGVSILVYDTARDADAPQAVLTGDTLFIGDVGRPDLMASQGVTAEELAGSLYDSLHGKLLRLPDATIVYPAHGAGSACGKNMSKETSSTLGTQKQVNWALQPMARDEFVRRLVANQPAAPAYFAFDADLNKRERTTLGAALERGLKGLALDLVLQHAREGAVILDVREADEYAAWHLLGSVNIGLGGRFASWAGTVLDRTQPIVIVAPPGREVEAALRLGRIGFDHVAGYLAGGPEAFARRPDVARASERVDAAAVAAELAGPSAPFVLDVRSPEEHAEGHIEGSLNVPLETLEQGLARIPRQDRIVVHCRSGYRSSIAASLLERHGIESTVDLRGGFLAWESATTSRRA
jgi:rhodanese-related sulfurtransferase/glyoxylase-like metal-dependent hydrolase (beta-lactamase superfamily II)